MICFAIGVHGTRMHEYVACYVKGSTTGYGASLFNSTNEFSKQTYNSYDYKANAQIYGDAIFETFSWHGGSSFLLYPGKEVVMRGGGGSIYGFEGDNGAGYDYFGFRPVLIVSN